MTQKNQKNEKMGSKMRCALHEAFFVKMELKNRGKKGVFLRIYRKLQVKNDQKHKKCLYRAITFFVFFV